jgi:hypothetical protein
MATQDCTQTRTETQRTALSPPSAPGKGGDRLLPRRSITPVLKKVSVELLTITQPPGLRRRDQWLLPVHERLSDRPWFDRSSRHPPNDARNGDSKEKSNHPVAFRHDRLPSTGDPALDSALSHTETSSYLRNLAVSRGFERPSCVTRWRPDWLAGAAGLELGNVAFRSISYLFEISQRFCQNKAGIGLPETFSRRSCKTAGSAPGCQSTASVMLDHSWRRLLLVSGTADHGMGVTAAAWLRAVGPPWILPRRLFRLCGASVVTARDAVGTAWAKMP